MRKRSNKLAAPVIITVLLILYLFAFVFIWTVVPVPLIIQILGTVIPLAFVGVSIHVLAERIKEIRSGEEDDLSKY